MIGLPLLHRLDARDRALFVRLAMRPSSSARLRRLWRVVTHLGGTWCSLAAATFPLRADGPMHEAARLALGALVISHVLVQAVKRTVGRARPSRGTSCASLIAEPDRFSFPSGHAAAAMSVACGYALVFPALAGPLVAVAFLVGISRVCLAVHYPGDVLVGQLIALATVVALVMR
jgi:undecaprenyl-diphosphatase